MTGSPKKTTFKTVLMWVGIALAAAVVVLPMLLVARSARQLNAKREVARARFEQGKAELRRIEALDRVRSEKLAAAKTMIPSSEPCLVVPAVGEPPMKQGSDLSSQLWRTYMRELTSADSPFELRGSAAMVGLTSEPGGPRLRKLRTTVSWIEGCLTQGSVRDDCPELPPAKDWQRDVTITIEEHHNPHLLSGQREFEAGHASGTAFLFDYERGDVVCVGHFEATNSDTFVANVRKEYGMEFTADLHHDLNARTVVAAVRSLRAMN